MAKYTNTVEYQLRTTLDSSGLTKLQTQLLELQSIAQTKFAKGIIPDSAFQKTMADIKQVQNALNSAFNGKLGMMNLGQFQKQVLSGGRSLSSYYQTFSNLGAEGTRAFGQLYRNMTKIDMGMKQISSTSDKIMNTLGNTVR